VKRDIDHDIYEFEDLFTSSPWLFHPFLTSTNDLNIANVSISKQANLYTAESYGQLTNVLGPRCDVHAYTVRVITHVGLQLFNTGSYSARS